MTSSFFSVKFHINANSQAVLATVCAVTFLCSVTVLASSSGYGVTVWSNICATSSAMSNTRWSLPAGAAITSRVARSLANLNGAPTTPRGCPALAPCGAYAT